MAYILGMLEKELSRPYNWLKKSAKEASFFGAVSVPPAVSEMLGKYNISVNGTDAQFNYSQMQDIMNQTVEKATSRIVSQTLPVIDTHYGQSIQSLNNIGDVVGRMKVAIDPDGNVNTTWVSSQIDRIHPSLQNETARLSEFAVEHTKNYIIQHYAPEMIAIAAAAIGTLVLAWYAGTRLAMREKKPYEVVGVKNFDTDGNSSRWSLSRLFGRQKEETKTRIQPRPSYTSHIPKFN